MDRKTEGVASTHFSPRILLEKYKELQANSPIKLDSWQEQVLQHSGNIAIRAGRQVGKSTVIAKKAVLFGLENEKTNILIIAASQRQSSLLFQKIEAELNSLNHLILSEKGGYKDKTSLSLGRTQRRGESLRRIPEFLRTSQAKTEIRLKNGTIIYSLPAGKTGYFIGFSLRSANRRRSCLYPRDCLAAVTSDDCSQQRKKESRAYNPVINAVWQRRILL